MNHNDTNPAIYDTWYQSARGSWIGQQEFSALLKLFSPKQGQSLLDVGCGTGYFSQHFQQTGLYVTGLDTDSAMIDFAKAKKARLNILKVKLKIYHLQIIHLITVQR